RWEAGGGCGKGQGASTDSMTEQNGRFNTCWSCWPCTHTHTHTCTCMHAHTLRHPPTHTHTHTCTSTHTLRHTPTDTRAHNHTPPHTHTHTHTDAHTCTDNIRFALNVHL